MNLIQLIKNVDSRYKYRIFKYIRSDGDTSFITNHYMPKFEITTGVDSFLVLRVL